MKTISYAIGDETEFLIGTPRVTNLREEMFYSSLPNKYREYVYVYVDDELTLVIPFAKIWSCWAKRPGVAGHLTYEKANAFYDILDRWIRFRLRKCQLKP